jgi:hypothetical protein
MMLKNGSKHENVKCVQEILQELGYHPGAADGDFGDKTEAAVIQFQERHNLYADGVVGPSTWARLHEALKINLEERFCPLIPGASQPDLMPWIRVPADKFRDGYDRFFLREDVAEAYKRVRQTLVQAGALLTSSGARRALNAEVGASRSATSFHYTGRALDLHVGSGMENRARDPFVIVPEADRYWRVYARAEGGEPMDLEAVTYGSRNSGKKVSGKFIDLTRLFENEGFKRIRARRSFFSGGSWLGAEWWHFQYETGLQQGRSTFGQELLKVYPEAQLQGTPPWKYRDRVFGVDWF